METCVIVDGYRFSEDYFFYLERKKIACIYVQSTASLISSMASSSTYDAAHYVAHYVFDGDIDVLLALLKKHDPVAVIAGMESGVLLADELSFRLNLQSNIFSLSAARRNKFSMQEALKKADVPCMRYINTSDVHEAIEWIALNTTYPVVIKPLESAGTEGVYVCENELGLRVRFKDILKSNNCFGNENQSVLVQEFLSGTEFIVNSVSVEGEHFFTDTWRCQKRHIKNHGMIYDREELLQYDDPLQKELQRYMRYVLNALGFEYGAAHAEVMLTNRGPLLIEVGARVGGNVNCSAHTACLEFNQLELAVDAYTDEDAFSHKITHKIGNQKNAMIILLSTQQSGKIQSLPIIDLIQSCQSLYWYKLSVQVGDFLKPTRDLFTSPGKVILIHDNKEIIRSDYESIVSMMDSGFGVECEVLYDKVIQ